MSESFEMKRAKREFEDSIEKFNPFRERHTTLFQKDPEAKPHIKVYRKDAVNYFLRKYQQFERFCKQLSDKEFYEVDEEEQIA